MINDKCPRKILVVAMLNSIHTARWLSQFGDVKNYEIHLYNSVNSEVHPMLARDPFFIFHTGNLVDVIDTVKPDIVHTLEMQHSAYLLLPIREASDVFPFWVYSCWGSDIKWFKKFSDDRKKMRGIFSYIDAMLCEDQDSINIAKEVFHFNKPCLKVPGPGGYKVDEMRGKNRFVLPSKRKIIAVKGYTGWVYRPETVFSALKKCSKELISGGYKVVIYVPGDIDVYVDELKKKGVSVKKFNWTSNYEEILSLFAQSRINLASSLSDGIPNSMLEGMIMGAYPIQSAVNFSNFKDFVKDEQNGILLDPLDVDGYILAIKKALADDNLVNNAAKNNFLLIKSKIDYQLVKKNVLDFFDSFYYSRVDVSFKLKKVCWMIFGRNFKIYINVLKIFKTKIKNKINGLLCCVFPTYRKLFFINQRVLLMDEKLNDLNNKYEKILIILEENLKNN